MHQIGDMFIGFTAGVSPRKKDIHRHSKKASEDSSLPSIGSPQMLSSSPKSPRGLVRRISETFSHSISNFETHHRLYHYHHVLLKKAALSVYTREDIAEVRNICRELVEWVQIGHDRSTRNEAASLLTIVIRAPDPCAFILLDKELNESLRFAINGSSSPTDNLSNGLEHSQELSTLLDHLVIRGNIARSRAAIKELAALQFPSLSERLYLREICADLIELTKIQQTEIWVKLLVIDLLAYVAKHPQLASVLLEEVIYRDVNRLARARLGGLASNKLASRMLHLASQQLEESKTVRDEPEIKQTRTSSEVVVTITETDSDVFSMDETSSVADEVAHILALNRMTEDDANRLRGCCQLLIKDLSSESASRRRTAHATLMSVAKKDSLTSFILVDPEIYKGVEDLWAEGSSLVVDLFKVIKDIMAKKLNLMDRIIEKKSQLSTLPEKDLKTLGNVFDDLVSICESNVYEDTMIEAALSSLQLAAEASDPCAFLLAERFRYERLKTIFSAPSASKRLQLLGKAVRQARVRKGLWSNVTLLRKNIDSGKTGDAELEGVRNACRTLLDYADDANVPKAQQTAIEGLLVVAEGPLQFAIVLLAPEFLSKLRGIASSPVAPPLASDLGEALDEIEEAATVHSIRQMLERVSAKDKLSSVDAKQVKAGCETMEELCRQATAPTRATEEAIMGLFFAATGKTVARQATSILQAMTSTAGAETTAATPTLTQYQQHQQDREGEQGWLEHLQPQFEKVIADFLQRAQGQLDTICRLSSLDDEQVKVTTLLCIRLVHVCQMQCEQSFRDSALDMISLVAKAADPCASILLTNGIYSEIRRMSKDAADRVATMHASVRSQSILDRVIVLLEEVQERMGD